MSKVKKGESNTSLLQNINKHNIMCASHNNKKKKKKKGSTSTSGGAGRSLCNSTPDVEEIVVKKRIPLFDLSSEDGATVLSYVIKSSASAELTYETLNKVEKSVKSKTAPSSSSTTALPRKNSSGTTPSARNGSRCDSLSQNTSSHSSQIQEMNGKKPAPVTTNCKIRKTTTPDVEVIVVKKRIPMFDLSSEDGTTVQSFVIKSSAS